nr:hypothetical protein [Tanacetum cinerariifolium]
MDSNCEDMSNVEANLKGNESSDQHAAKNGSQERNGGESNDFTPMDTAKPNYDKAVGSNNIDLDKNLFFVPSGINDNGEEVVIFKEELVSEGCKKWQMTVCGYFVGCSLSHAEIRLVNVPLEAWTPRGISTLASRLGKPIMMDSTTANMCHKGIGRTCYARVLVEMEANKGLPDKIEVVYKDVMNNTTLTKFLSVEYDWKPVICNTCGVFGHRDSICRKRMVNAEENEIRKEKGVSANNGKKVDMKGFVKVINRKKLGNGNNNHMRYKNKEVNVSQKFQYRPKEKQRNVTDQEDSLKNNENQKKIKVDMEKKYDSPPSFEKLWRVNSETMNNIHKSANKYVVLAEDIEMEEYEKVINHGA